MATETIDMTPTWSGILPGLIAATEDGTAEGKHIARVELGRMAQAADRWNEHAPAMRDALTAGLAAVVLAMPLPGESAAGAALLAFEERARAILAQLGA